ncbi:MAG TPA: TonB family protein [Candidatus Angelobacter sp.]|jgi:TonB family protein|nr:TonB family protein [Candidatus Angelobacter sp.]
MVSVPNATPNKPSPAPDRDLAFLIEPEPWLRIFLRNLGDLFRPTPPKIWLTSQPGEYWADALVNRPVPWTAMRKSSLLHLLAAVSIYGLTMTWLNQPQVLPQSVPRNTISYYEVSKYLPPVKSAHPKPEAVRRRPQKADPEFAPQEIVSIETGHKSTLQTVVNPVSPQLLNQDTPLPNIVVWTSTPSPAPVARNHPLVFPYATPPVVPPAPETAKRNLKSLLAPDAQPDAVAPASQPVNRNLAALNVPVQPQAAVPPAPSNVQRNLGEMNLAFNTPAVEAPKLPVPEQQVSNAEQTSQQGQPAAANIPAAQPITAGIGKAQAQEVGQLLALNAQPIAPSGTITVPEGNRPGEFAAGPTGHAGATARPEIKSGASSVPGGQTEGSGTPAGIFVSDPPRKVGSGAVVALAPPSPAVPSKPDGHIDVPLRNSNDVPTSGRIENQVFGGKRYYSMSLNMPNLTSSAGSWIIRFAEMHPQPGAAGENLSAPVALYKVDPAYPADLMRDKVEGVVVLYAVIHSDGSVGEVRILEGIHDDLDHNASTALQKWHFRPGTKNGLPVDLEAVIRVPFKASRTAF